MQEQFDIWKFLAGLGIFLFGMYLVEQALKHLVGRNFKKFLRHQTTNPVKGVLGGTLITAILQSSSVVSLMVLAFVGAGIIELKNALGIIFGSNLGTTFTGWIVASLGFRLNIETFALPLIALGGIIMILFEKREKMQEAGKFMLGFGFLFLGLDFMKVSIEHFSDQFDLGIFSGWNPYLFFLVGFLLTAVIQSSSAAMVITLSGLNAGIISLEAAAAMVIGNDLGTTITVLLGGIRGTPSKKRVALSHFLFNLITDLLALALMYPLLMFITEIIGLSDPLFVLVLFHSSFNFVGIVIMLPFIGLFARFLENRFTNGEGHIVKYIQKVPSDVPEAAIEALRNEIIHFVDEVIYLNITALRISPGLFNFPHKEKEERLFSVNTYLENYATLKQLEGSIIAYCLDIQNEKLEEEEIHQLNRYIQTVRSAMISAKEIKDIKHNIHEFEASSNDTKQSLYQYLKGQLNEYYLSLHHIFHSDRNAAFFETLADLLQENQHIYDRFLKEIYHQISQRTLSEMEISTLLNVNREIYHSNRSLILAIKDILLTKEEIESFKLLPEAK